MSSSETVAQYFSRVTDLVNKMRVYREKISDNKVVEKNSSHHIDKIGSCDDIIKADNIDTMIIAELQGSIESHVSIILEKIEKIIEEALKSP